MLRAYQEDAKPPKAVMYVVHSVTIPMVKTIVVSFDVEPDYPPFLVDSHMGVDDGLPRLLDLFRAEKIPANVFFLAELCNAYETLPREIVKQGFHLGNHSMNHNLLCIEDFERQMQLLTESTRLIEEASGVKMTTFRAPNFSFNEDTLRCLEKAGYLIDSSVLPERRERKGIRGYAYDFRGATRVPYHPSNDDVRKPGASPVLEIPSTENPLVREIPIGGGFLNTYGAARGLEAVSKAQGEVVVMVFHPWEFVGLYDRYPTLPKWIKAGCRRDLSTLSEFLGTARDQGWTFTTLEDVAESFQKAHPEIPVGEAASQEVQAHIPQPRMEIHGRRERGGGAVAGPLRGSRPKIMLMWPYFYPEVNAAATRAAAFAKYFREAGADVEILAPLRPNLPEETWVDGMRVRRLATYETARLDHGTVYSAIYMPRSVSRIREIIERSQPSLLMTSSPSPFFAYETLKANKKFALPLVFDIRDLWPYDVLAGGGRLRNRMKKRVERRCARGADKVFIVTESMRELLIEDHAIRLKNIAVVPNGADLDLFKSLSSEKSWDIMVLGSASKYRNLEQAFEMFSHILKKRPETRILYLGWRKDRYTMSLEKLAEELGLLPAMQLNPPVPLDQVPAILSSGRIGLVSQTWDAPIRAAIAVKAYEYMAAGLPIACLGPPEDCELKRLVMKTGAGLYESSPVSLGNGVCELLSDNAKLVAFAAAARQAAVRFDRGTIVRQAYTQYLLPLLEGRRGG